ncbi:MAG TPA: 7,8-didemethyl-8-hydroxy-5-deazariboflavin synthase CofG [Candidatus Xenobia bacterium]
MKTLDPVELMGARGKVLDELLREAGRLRDEAHGRTVTFSPKVFLPVTNLCRDHCSYCTFRKNPNDPGAWTMTVGEIRDVCRTGRRQSCQEALMCLGDKPELAFSSYRKMLREWGYDSTADYVYRACQVALEEDMLPHTNAGIMSREEMVRLRPVNASMGLMLENVSPRLREKGQAHHAAPDKEPAVRMRMLEEAGELNIPFTTGLLVGIGETLQERVDTLVAIRDLHARYGHVQEVIVQNFRAKPGTRMEGAVEVCAEEMAATVAVARLILGGEMHLQAPPNLSPDDHRLLLRAGLDDWGGVSPVTQDYINPEAPWPHLRDLQATCRAEGFELRPRLPVYREYVKPEFVAPGLLARVLAAEEKLLCLN